ncbi:hypothetical protein H9P43_001963 [Blastocladiella emersonii ATCC 22665]|nr:hypothetical protein H9P43_001963 [Blastocladiella emersonii ATCC 22665]
MLFTPLLLEPWANVVWPFVTVACIYAIAFGAWGDHWSRTIRAMYMLAERYPSPEANPVESGYLPTVANLLSLSVPQATQPATTANAATSTVLPLHNPSPVGGGAPPAPPPRFLPSGRPAIPSPALHKLVSTFVTLKFIWTGAIAAAMVVNKLRPGTIPQPTSLTSWPIILAMIMDGIVIGLSFVVAGAMAIGLSLVRDRLDARDTSLLRGLFVIGMLSTILTASLDRYAPLWSIGTLLVVQRALNPAIQQALAYMAALLTVHGTLRVPGMFHPRTLPVVHAKLRWLGTTQKLLGGWMMTVAVRELLALSLDTYVGLSGRSGTAGQLTAGRGITAWALVAAREIPDVVMAGALAAHARLRLPVPWNGVRSSNAAERAARIAARTRPPTGAAAIEMQSLDSLDRRGVHPWAMDEVAAREPRPAGTYRLVVLPGDDCAIPHPYVWGGSGCHLAMAEDAGDRAREAERLARVFRKRCEGVGVGVGVGVVGS